MKQVLYINLYRAGFYHRQGKPNTTNLHGGDVYVTEEQAMENAETDKGYITTVSLEADFPGAVLVNPPDSEPDPLSLTRYPGRYLGERYIKPLPYLLNESSSDSSLEVGDGHYGVGYEDWYAAQHGAVWHREPQP